MPLKQPRAKIFSNSRALWSSPWLGLGSRTCFCMVQKNYITDLETKIGRSANGGDQPVSGRYSLTDHKKPLTFPYDVIRVVTDSRQ